MNALALALALLAGPDPQADAASSQPATETGARTADSGFLDLDRLELGAWAGMVMYSEDFESDPMPAGGIVLRAPMPWISTDATEFGAFVHFTGAQVDRDLDFLEENSGTVFFFGAGADLNLISDERWSLRAQAGVQYEYFGNVTDLDDGFAGLVGLSAGVNVSKGFRIGVTPQAYLADAGDWISAVQFGLTVRF